MKLNELKTINQKKKKESVEELALVKVKPVAGV